MPGIFYRNKGRWCMAPVATPGLLRLDPFNIEPSDPMGLLSTAIACPLVHIAAQNKWAVLVARDMALRHNGVPITPGLRMLEHRDALALDGGLLLFFSTEERAHAATFEEVATVSCPRCRSDVRQGDAVVRCPSCGVVHHEQSERNCWTYAETCAVCPQPSALDAGLRWTPEDL